MYLFVTDIEYTVGEWRKDCQWCIFSLSSGSLILIQQWRSWYRVMSCVNLLLHTIPYLLATWIFFHMRIWITQICNIAAVITAAARAEKHVVTVNLPFPEPVETNFFVFQVSDWESQWSADSSRAHSQFMACVPATCASVCERFLPSDGNKAFSPSVCPDPALIQADLRSSHGLCSVTEPLPLLFHPDPAPVGSTELTTLVHTQWAVSQLLPAYCELRQPALSINGSTGIWLISNKRKGQIRIWLLGKLESEVMNRSLTFAPFTPLQSHFPHDAPQPWGWRDT